MRFTYHMDEQEIEQALISRAREQGPVPEGMIGSASMACGQGDPGHYADRGPTFSASVSFQRPPRGEEADGASSPRLEKLAALEHEQWAHWTRHMLQALAPALVALEMSGDLSDDVDEAVSRWRRQMETPYAELTESEKDSDREWARKVLAE